MYSVLYLIFLLMQFLIINLRNINCKKATGLDNIPGHVIRSLRAELVRPITEIVNKSIDLCVFPNPWKSHSCHTVT